MKVKDIGGWSAWTCDVFTTNFRRHQLQLTSYRYSKKVLTKTWCQIDEGALLFVTIFAYKGRMYHMHWVRWHHTDRPYQKTKGIRKHNHYFSYSFFLLKMYLADRVWLLLFADLQQGMLRWGVMFLCLPTFIINRYKINTFLRWLGFDLAL